MKGLVICHRKGNVNNVSSKVGGGRDALAETGEGRSNQEGNSTRGDTVGEICVKVARVGNAGKENVIIVLGSNLANIPIAD
jgi:hypothetical protein